MQQISNKELFESFNRINGQIELFGWVKSNRDNGNFGFISFSDGSCNVPVQLVYKKEITKKGFDELKNVNTGSAIYVQGTVVITPDAKQPFEVVVDEAIVLKQASEDYPLQKKHHTVEYLREIAHLRSSTNLFNNIMRVRSMLFNALNNFFIANNFVWVSTPVLTSNDGEGAGETFKLQKIDNKDFFGTESSLSVTGQLHLEAYTLGFKKVYTFGPQFRAEKSHTNRHAAEFWMLEAEVAFMGVNGLMDLIEKMLKSIVNFYKTECEYEMEFFNQYVDENSKSRVDKILKNEFARVSYTEVIDILLDAKNNKNVVFENNNIFWGMDLESEHERFICEKVFNQPTFVYNYPSELKAFYMKQNDDNKTVAGVDLLVPGVGELCGGSEREPNYDILLKKAQKINVNIDDLDWYISLRKYGYYRSAGFGLGFERLIMFLTGVSNIRDVIPFPRTHGSIKY